ncbi:uncharacterized protein LOC116420307 [Sarcophilus harrisii]|uniref:uncharacterized protein LOC116420307 n=1 Tax=Sarcophilus harrisii TaxID=9305 RepID=UPI001301A4E4|nr:uncharacterized protein LOC116420307 [Sarcophilus harrisii]
MTDSGSARWRRRERQGEESEEEPGTVCCALAANLAGVGCAAAGAAARDGKDCKARDNRGEAEQSSAGGGPGPDGGSQRFSSGPGSRNSPKPWASVRVPGTGRSVGATEYRSGRDHHRGADNISTKSSDSDVSDASVVSRTSSASRFSSTSHMSVQSERPRGHKKIRCSVRKKRSQERCCTGDVRSLGMLEYTFALNAHILQ